MKAITIRLPDDLADYIERESAGNLRSQQQESIARLESTRVDALVLGWLKVARWGEIEDRDDEGNPFVECPECGQDMDKNNCYIALLSNGQHYGTVCNECATSA